MSLRIPEIDPTTIRRMPLCRCHCTTAAPSGHYLCPTGLLLVGHHSSSIRSLSLSLFGVHVPSFGCCHCRGCAFRISSLSALSGHRPTVFQSCVWSVRLCGRLFGPFDPSYCVLCLFGHLCLVHPSVSFQRYWLMSGLHPHLLRLIRPFGVNWLWFWFRFRFRLALCCFF